MFWNGRPSHTLDREGLDSPRTLSGSVQHPRNKRVGNSSSVFSSRLFPAEEGWKEVSAGSHPYKHNHAGFGI